MASIEPIKVQIEGLDELRATVREFREAARELRRAAEIATSAARKAAK